MIHAINMITIEMIFSKFFFNVTFLFLLLLLHGTVGHAWAKASPTYLSLYALLLLISRHFHSRDSIRVKKKKGIEQNESGEFRSKCVLYLFQNLF